MKKEFEIHSTDDQIFDDIEAHMISHAPEIFYYAHAGDSRRKIVSSWSQLKTESCYADNESFEVVKTNIPEYLRLVCESFMSSDLKTVEHIETLCVVSMSVGFKSLDEIFDFAQLDQKNSSNLKSILPSFLSADVFGIYLKSEAGNSFRQNDSAPRSGVHLIQ